MNKLGEREKYPKNYWIDNNLKLNIELDQLYFKI